MSLVLRSRQWSVLGALILVSVLGVGAARADAAAPGRKAVFVTTNSANGNAVLAFSRAADGTLTPAGAFPTGGLGAGAGLGSQGALTLSAGGRWLLAVNAGSNDVSVLDVDSDGLALVSRAPSGGARPISVTAYKDLVYVLNAGGTANIAGCRLDWHGVLHAIGGSTRPLSSANPGGAEVDFTPDGRWLVVTEKATSKIDTYAVDANGVAHGPTVSASSGATPFGFGIDRRGHVIVSEAGPGAVSSYNIGANGLLHTISASVMDVGQTAACWIAISGNGRFAYAANAHSGTITGFSVAQDGSLSLLNANAITAAPGGAPLDMTFSENSQFLYVFNSGSMHIDAYAVGSDGSLTAVSSMPGLPASAAGIAAR